MPDILRSAHKNSVRPMGEFFGKLERETNGMLIRVGNAAPHSAEGFCGYPPFARKKRRMGTRQLILSQERGPLSLFLDHIAITTEGEKVKSIARNGQASSP